MFEELPNDRKEDDTIIVNEATNALKYVNCNFASHLGGHRKRKLVSVPKRFDANVSPTRRLRRTI